jgi:HPt (histidine-containing phosphotransfer) domain-containing protein
MRRSLPTGAEPNSDLAKLAHQLKGTAGLYEFLDISHSAAVVEDDALRGETIESITSQVQELIAMIRNVSGYDRAKETKIAKDE